MIRVRSAFTAALLALLAGSASAQGIPGMPGTPGQRSLHFGIGGGLSMPVSDAANALKSGGQGQAFVEWKPLGMPWGLRATASYDRHGLKGLGAGQDGHSTVLGGLGNLTMGFPLGPITPYLTAGLGAFNLATTAGGSSASTTRFGVDGGAGVRFRLAAISGFVEGRVDNVFTDQGLSPNVQNSQNLKTLIIPVTFGLMF
jgi:opacity protein-like surface antigen